MNTSTVLHRLTPQELEAVKAELQSSPIPFDTTGSHIRQPVGSFRPTRHAAMIMVYDEATGVDNSKHFAQTLVLVQERAAAQNRKLVRSFWCRLPPGHQVDVHADGQPYHKAVDRFQLYLEVPTLAVVVMDEVLWNFSPEKKLENSLIYFAKERLHFYFNGSAQDLYILVIDFGRG